MSGSESKRDAAASQEDGRKNYVWSALDFAVFPALMLVATPLFIRFLGIEQFGILVLLNSLVGVSLIFNFGFGDAVLKYVSYYEARIDKQRAASIVRTVSFLTLAIGGSIAALIACSNSAVASIFNIESFSNAKFTLLIISALVPLRMLESIYVSTLRGLSRYDLSGSVSIVIKLLTVGSQIFLVVNGHGLTAIFIVTLSTAVLSTIVLFSICWRDLGNLIPVFRIDDFREIRGFSSWTWLQGISSLLLMNADRLVIAALLGPATLGVYGVCLQVAQNLHNGLAALAHPLYPRFSSLFSGQSIGERANDEFRKLYVNSSRRMTVLAVFAASVVAVFSYDILYLWVGVDIATDAHLMLSLVVIATGWFTANQTVTTYALNGLGMAKLQAIVSIIAASLLTMGSLVFVSYFGAIGAALSRFLESPVRLAARIHLGRNIVGGVRVWHALDFPFLMVIAVPLCLSFRQFFMQTNSEQPLDLNPWVIAFFPVFLWSLYVSLSKVANKCFSDPR